MSTRIVRTIFLNIINKISVIIIKDRLLIANVYFFKFKLIFHGIRYYLSLFHRHNLSL